MLRKTSGVARGPRSSFIGKATEMVVDRRAFLRGSGLAIGGVVQLQRLSVQMLSRRKLLQLGEPQKLKSRFALTVLSVVL